MLNSRQYGIAQMVEQVLVSVVFLCTVELCLDGGTIQRRASKKIDVAFRFF